MGSGYAGGWFSHCLLLLPLHELLVILQAAAELAAAVGASPHRRAQWRQRVTAAAAWIRRRTGTDTKGARDTPDAADDADSALREAARRRSTRECTRWKRNAAAASLCGDRWGRRPV